MDKETAKLFPTIDKDILEKMNEEEPQEDTAVVDIPRQKIIKHKEVFINEEAPKQEAPKQEAPKKKKEYPHLVKARAKAKANREAKKQAKLEAKLNSKEATKKKRLEKQRVASKEINIRTI